MAAAIKLAELECDVILMSLLPVKRSHSVCAQGGINSVNDLTRQLGDSEWKHFEDTVYGGDFLQHQPPVKELAYWAPKIIDLMDRLGVTFNRTPEGFRDQRRFGGTLYQRTAFAGATTGQQLVYALDEQVRRWEVTGHIRKYEYWDFLGPVIDEAGRCRGAVGQDLVSMEIRAFPADALVIGSGGCGAIYGRSTNSVACNGAAVSRVYQAGGRYGNAEFIQVHPTAIPGADKLRLISESARGEGGRIWVPRKPQDPRSPQDIPEKERYYFLEERYPKYGNLVPRDIGTREIFKVCMQEGLSVQAGRMCVYLDVTHIPREQLDRKLSGILEIYEKFQGADPRKVPMKIFPGVHYTMGGLWVDYEANGQGGLNVGSPRNQQTNIPGLYAIGECEYQYHGANRLGANSLVACIFSGLTVAPGIVNYVSSFSGQKSNELPSGTFDQARRKHQEYYDSLLKRPAGGPNPYKVHAELGQIMTKSATVVRHNDEMKADLRQGLRAAAAGRPLVDLGHQHLGQPDGAVREGLGGHVPGGQGDPARGHRPRRIARRRLQARVRADGAHGHRAGPAAPRGRGLVRSLRGQQPQVAEVDDRRLRARRRADAELRRGQHQPDSAPAPAVRPRRRRRDRAGLEAAASRGEEIKSEIRISKSETNSKYKIYKMNTQNRQFRK